MWFDERTCRDGKSENLLFMEVIGVKVVCATSTGLVREQSLILVRNVQCCVWWWSHCISLHFATKSRFMC